MTLWVSLGTLPMGCHKLVWLRAALASLFSMAADDVLILRQLWAVAGVPQPSCRGQAMSGCDGCRGQAMAGCDTPQSRAGPAVG